jgi:hypothetical protein
MTVPATPKKEAATVALTAASTLATVWVTEMPSRCGCSPLNRTFSDWVGGVTDFVSSLRRWCFGHLPR